jgi:hypothetical protein
LPRSKRNGGGKLQEAGSVQSRMRAVALIVLRGHPFHQKSDDELRALIYGASEGARAIRSIDVEAEAEFLCQLNDAFTILGARRHRERMIAQEAM